MSAIITKYDHFEKLLCNGSIDWDTNTLKLALVTSSYTPSVTHTQWADVSTNEVAAGSGYTTGGETIGGATVTNTGMDAADVTWTALTKTFRYAVAYRNGTVGGLVNPLMFYILLDDTPADVSPSAEDYIIRWNAAGIFTFAA